LLKVEALAEGGVVEVEDGDKLTRFESFRESQFGYANLEVSARLVDISNEIKSPGEFSFFFGRRPTPTWIRPTLLSKILNDVQHCLGVLLSFLGPSPSFFLSL